MKKGDFGLPRAEGAERSKERIKKREDGQNSTKRTEEKECDTVD